MRFVSYKKIVFHILTKTKEKFSKDKREGHLTHKAQFPKNLLFQMQIYEGMDNFWLFYILSQKFVCVYVFVFDWENKKKENIGIH